MNTFEERLERKRVSEAGMRGAEEKKVGRKEGLVGEWRVMGTLGGSKQEHRVRSSGREMD